MVTDPQTHTHTQDRLQYTAPQLARSVTIHVFFKNLVNNVFHYADIKKCQLSSVPLWNWDANPLIRELFIAQPTSVGIILCTQVQYTCTSSRQRSNPLHTSTVHKYSTHVRHLGNVLMNNEETTTRSSARGDLVVQRTRTKFGGRAFVVAGPAAWNRLPCSVRNSPSLDSFKTALKTFPFTANI